MRDKKIGVDLMVSGTNGHGYVRPRKSVPGLLWAELTMLMNDWGRFELGLSGTRFDRWLSGGVKTTPKIQSSRIGAFEGKFILVWYLDERHAARVAEVFEGGKCKLEFVTGNEKGVAKVFGYDPGQEIEVYMTAEEAIERRNQQVRQDRKDKAARKERERDVKAGRIIPSCEHLNEAKGKFVVVRNIRDGIVKVVKLEDVRQVGEWRSRQLTFNYKGESRSTLFNSNRRDTRIYRTAKEAAKVLGGRMEKRSSNVPGTKTPEGMMEIGL